MDELKGKSLLKELEEKSGFVLKIASLGSLILTALGILLIWVKHEFIISTSDSIYFIFTGVVSLLLFGSLFVFIFVSFINLHHSWMKSFATKDKAILLYIISIVIELGFWLLYLFFNGSFYKLLLALGLGLIFCFELAYVLKWTNSREISDFIRQIFTFLFVSFYSWIVITVMVSISVSIFIYFGKTFKLSLSTLLKLPVLLWLKLIVLLILLTLLVAPITVIMKGEKKYFFENIYLLAILLFLIFALSTDLPYKSLRLGYKGGDFPMCYSTKQAPENYFKANLVYRSEGWMRIEEISSTPVSKWECEKWLLGEEGIGKNNKNPEPISNNRPTIRLINEGMLREVIFKNPSWKNTQGNTHKRD